MKQCKWCKKSKQLSDFTKNKREKDGYRRVCRECSKTYERERYHKDPSIRVLHATGQENRLYRNRMYLFNYLKNHPCVDCGETDPILLEFDHVRDKKKCSVSQLIAQGYATATIQKEIDKCEVRCVACHRRKTWDQFGWYDKIDPPQHHKQLTKLQEIRNGVILRLRGSQVKGSKLDEEKVLQMKSMFQDGTTPTEAATIFNVSYETANNIKNGKSWKHVVLNISSQKKV